jgi:hypothetical protein
MTSAVRRRAVVVLDHRAVGAAEVGWQVGGDLGDELVLGQVVVDLGVRAPVPSSTAVPRVHSRPAGPLGVAAKEVGDLVDQQAAQLVDLEFVDPERVGADLPPRVDRDGAAARR